MIVFCQYASKQNKTGAVIRAQGIKKGRCIFMHLPQLYYRIRAESLRDQCFSSSRASPCLMLPEAFAVTAAYSSVLHTMSGVVRG